MNLEKIVIGLIIHSEGQYLELAEALGIKREMFVKSSYQTLFHSVMELQKQGAEINLHTVGMKEPTHVSDMLEAIEAAPLAQNFMYYAKLLVDGYWRKNCALKLSRLASDMIAADPLTDASKFRIALQILTDENIGDTKSGFEGIWANELIPSVIDDIEKAVVRHRSGGKEGSDSGFSCLNANLGGWVPSRYHILAARTSIGKTTFAVNTAIAVLKEGRHVAFFTNEMKETTIFKKAISVLGQVHGRKIEDGNLGEDELNRIHYALQQMHPMKFYLNHRAGRLIETFEMECRRLKRLKQLDFVILDYVQQMDSNQTQKFSNKNSSLTYVSDRLKKLALELDIPILALAQINREGESKFQKPTTGQAEDGPTIAQLKDSGSLEQDADVVIILHRERNVSEGHMLLKIVKNRHGKTGVWQISCDLKNNIFKD